jgi:hypothetical protein
MSGREEQFELGVAGGSQADLRLKEFARDPTLVLKTGNEVIVIPPHAIECLTLTLPQLDREPAPLSGARSVKRLK